MNRRRIWPSTAIDTDPEYEPTDTQLGATPPSDPFDSPSYATLTSKGSTK